MESYMATVQGGQERKTQKAQREPKIPRVRTDVRVKVKATVRCVVSEVPKNQHRRANSTFSFPSSFFFSSHAMQCSVQTWK
jgi:hypothetical protein